MSVWGQVLVILLLLLLNGFFAAAEMAVVSCNDNRIRGLAESGDRKAILLMRYIEDSGTFLSTIQVGITFAGFLSSSFAGSSFAESLANLIQPSGPSHAVYTLSLVLITLITSYLSIVIGEMVPKQIALANPERFSLKTVKVIRFMEIIFKPITALINASVNLILKAIGIDPRENQDVATEEEIRMLLDQGARSGSIERTESAMIVNIFEFDDKEVSEIMTHRINVIALDADSSFREVIYAAASERYSRVPVYEGDIDNIIGILHAKDLLQNITKDGLECLEEIEKDFDLREVVRDVYYVPASKRTNELLTEMQQNHISIAVVVDEYGGTAGIVTVEDLLEEIVGNIQDEYDEEDYGIRKIDDKTYIMSGMTSPEDINRILPDAYFDHENDEYDYDTIAGLVLAVLGRIPDEDEEVQIKYNNMIIQVLAMDDKRIDKVKLIITESAKEFKREQKAEIEAERKRQEKLLEEERQEELEELVEEAEGQNSTKNNNK